jgi:hypothetical protein
MFTKNRASITQGAKTSYDLNLDDLQAIAYRGLDPNAVCNWKSLPNQQSSVSLPLICHLLPRDKNDTKIDAWIYGYTDCQVDRLPLFAHLYALIPAALTYAPELEIPPTFKSWLLIQALYKKPNPNPCIDQYRWALRSMTTQNIKEMEITLQQLQDCYLTALMRVYPELHKELPLLKRREYSLKNSPEMNENQLKVTQEIIGNVALVLMAENIGEFDNALKELDKNYYGKYMNVNYDSSSDLSTILKKLIDGPISVIRKQMDDLRKFQTIVGDRVRKSASETNSLPENAEPVKTQVPINEKSHGTLLGTLFQLPTSSASSNTVAVNSTLPGYNHGS